MNSHERKMMDAMAGGDVMECYPEDVWDLIYKRAAQKKPYEHPESTYPLHQEENHVIVSEWEHRIHETSDMLPKLAEPVPQVISIVPEEQSLPQESAIRPLAQTNRTTNPVAQTPNRETYDTQASDERNTTISSDEYLETIIEAESMEEVCEITESRSIPAPTVMDDKGTSNSIEQEEDVQDETCLTVVTEQNEDLKNHAKDLISSQGIVGICTTDCLVMHEYYLLSSHVQDHGFGVSFGLEKVCGLSDEMCRETICIILGDAVSSFIRHKQRRHSIFGWKPGWDLWRTASSTSFNKDRRLEGTIGKEEVWESIEGVDAGSLSACKHISNGKRISRGEKRNWKRRRRAESAIKDDELFLFCLRNRKRCITYVWKPAWDKATQKVRTICRKFDGVHPWAPNL